jgi:hypothetical protein
MRQGAVLYHVAQADFLERVRRYSFLLTLGMALYLGYLAATGKLMLRLGNLRGIYNSAWIGGLMSLVAGCFLSLAGFYVVKNAIQRDRDTRVGKILAATPMTKWQYLLGKAISNFAVLALMVLILAISGVGMQYWQGEDSHLQLGKLLAPFFLLSLPMMALVAALAVVFESIPFLSGGFGNVAYFFAWSGLIVTPIASGSRVLDPTGIFVVGDSILRAANSSWEHGSLSLSLDFGKFHFVSAGLHWAGVDWTGKLILLRLLWLGVSLALIGLSAVFFDRFAGSRRSAAQKAETPEPQLNAPVTRSTSYRNLSRLSGAARKSNFGNLVAAELRLMLKGRSRWWYLVVCGLLIGTVVSPLVVSRGFLVAAWIWPILLWSQMGTREARSNTAGFIFSSAHAVERQLAAVWCAGVLLAAATGFGTALHLAIGHDWAGFAAWIGGALFIPSLALALGVWSGTSKVFEALYTVWWYIGPAHQIPGLDFMGVGQNSARPLSYLLFSAVLITAAYVGRRARVAYA